MCITLLYYWTYSSHLECMFKRSWKPLPKEKIYGPKAKCPGFRTRLVSPLTHYESCFLIYFYELDLFAYSYSY